MLSISHTWSSRAQRISSSYLLRKIEIVDTFQVDHCNVASSSHRWLPIKSLVREKLDQVEHNKLLLSRLSSHKSLSAMLSSNLKA